MSGSNSTSCKRTERNKCTNPWLQFGGRREEESKYMIQKWVSNLSQEMGQAGPNWPAMKLFCRNNQYNQYSVMGTPQHSSPSGQDAVTPPSPPRGHFFKAFCGPEVHVGMDPAIQLAVAAALRAGSCPWGWWLPTGLVVVPGAGDCPRGWWLPTELVVAHGPDGSARLWPQLTPQCCGFVSLNIDWPTSVRCAAVRSAPPPLSTGFLPLISLIVGSKPKSQLFKCYVYVMDTWQLIWYWWFRTCFCKRTF